MLFSSLAGLVNVMASLALLTPSALPNSTEATPLLIAILESGKRMECSKLAQPNDLRIQTPYGLFRTPTDKVVEVIDGTQDFIQLDRLRRLDSGAWIQRAQERGLLSALVTADIPAKHQEVWLNALQRIGQDLDPLPARTRQKDRVEELWKLFRKAEKGEAALLLGRVLVESQGPQASFERRVSLADIRKQMKRDAFHRWGAFRMAQRQLERDMILDLLEYSLREAVPFTRHAAAEAVLAVDDDLAQGHWAYHLFGRGTQERIHSAENLGLYGKQPEALEALMLALASTTSAPSPRRNVYFGTQVSVVTDFNVDVSRAAAIARPRISTLMSGIALQIRVLSSSTRKAVIQALGDLTGLKLGSQPEVWLKWYESR